jgi:hypothetical protein
MPPRHVTLAIVAFWLAMSGWLFYRDLWPRLRPGDPPPYVIDLVDEARFRESRNHWVVLENGKDIGYANTWVDYRQSDDTFRLNGEFKIRTPDGRGDPRVEVQSWYRVTRTGELREIDAQVKMRPGFAGLSFPVEGSVNGQVRDGKLVLRCRIPLFSVDKELDPVSVAERGSVLTTMQPLNRIHGLRAGQHWQIALFDPASAILPTANPKPRILSAEVVTGDLEIPPARPDFPALVIPCFVINYEGTDSRARTWVRQSDSTVLQQEASFGNEQLTLRRDLER